MSSAEVDLMSDVQLGHRVEVNKLYRADLCKQQDGTQEVKKNIVICGL